VSYLGFLFASCVWWPPACCGWLHDAFHAGCPQWTSWRPSCSATSAWCW